MERKLNVFEILYRRANDQPWEVYGRFEHEWEWERELAHIAFLREIGPLYLERRKVQ